MNRLRELERRLAKARRESEAAANLVRGLSVQLNNLRKSFGMTHVSVRASLQTIPRGEVFTIQQMSDLAGCSYATACNVLQRLHNQRRVTRVARGHYMRPLSSSKLEGCICRSGELAPDCPRHQYVYVSENQ